MSNLITQIGGKFSKYSPGLFDLKARLIQAGIKVVYPTGNSIVKTINGIDLSFDPMQTPLSFYEVECEYLRSIRSSSFHTVYNIYQNNIGYVGRSAGMEIGYAMVHQIPIVFLHEPSFQRSIAPDINILLNERISKFNVLRLDSISELDLVKRLEEISKLRVDYELSVESEISIMAYVQVILNEYRTQCI